MMNKLRMWLIKKLGGTIWIPTYEKYPVERVIGVASYYSKSPKEIEAAKLLVACEITREMLRGGRINFRLQESGSLSITTEPYELIGEVCVVQREDEGRHEKQG